MMKIKLFTTVLLFFAMFGGAFAADVGVSVSIGQPGFYGRIDIGDYPYPPPRVIYRQPRIVERVYIEREPIYLRVPPGHARNWPKFCGRYHACGEPVYFVQDNWYYNDYAPRYREIHHDDRHDAYDDSYHGKQKNKHQNKGKAKEKNHKH
jgi:hypothetical protein